MVKLQEVSELPDGLIDVDEETAGFVYLDTARRRLCCSETGKRCTDEEVHARVKAYVVPPQWSDVWVAKHPQAYLQVTGRDGKGRKQYIYHPSYVEHRQRLKFGKMVKLAEGLPKLRAEIASQLRRRKWDKERMLALMVHLLDQTKLRVGNERYLAQNKTYGLTTLRRKHLKRQPGGLALDFKGKSNKFRHVAVENKKLRKLLQQVSDLPGHQLFAYKNADGKRATLDSGDVNEYLRRHLGDAFSAKDFRTWGGTSLAVKFYPEVLADVQTTGKGKPAKRLVKAVAKSLGNTVSVCREYYIHPYVLAEAEAGTLPNKAWDPQPEVEELADYEKYTLKLIRRANRKTSQAD